MDARVAAELIKTRKAVKRKYDALKSDILQSQLEVQEKFKPISEPLKQLLSTIKTDTVQTKFEPQELKQSPKHIKTSSYSTHKTPRSTFSESPPTIKQPVFLESKVIAERSIEDNNEEAIDLGIDEDVLLDASIRQAQQVIGEMLQPEVMANYLEQYQGLARQYVEDMIRDTEDKFDLKYGVRFDLTTNKFAIGNKELDFAGEDVIIHDGKNKITYRGTPGFYELIFKKEPSGYTKADETNFADILRRTNAHKKNYDSSEQVSGNAGKKYKKIIQPLMMRNTTSIPKSSRKGAGLLQLNNKKIEFVPYKDPNILVDRLKTLIASQMAGHTGHVNDIIYTVDALKDAKCIK